MRILITGGKGQLGTDLKLLLQQGHEVYAWDADQLDITQGEEVIDKITDLNPEVVINTAAYTDVDGCEENEELAYQVNAYGARNVAVACQECGTKLVHISTDFVFDGTKNEPYIEFDQPNPLSMYGKIKLAGEELVRDIADKYFIVRTSWLYGKHGDNFVKTMLKLAKENQTLTVVDDQVGSPTYTRDLSLVIKELIKTRLYGRYHASNNGSCSWYQFAKKIFEFKSVDIDIEPISSDEFNRAATRPNYSVLCNFSLENQGIYKMSNWEKALKEYLMA